MKIRRTAVPDAVSRVRLGRGEKALAFATATDGRVVLGTRDALYLTAPAAERSSVVEPVETTRVPWQQVERADWDRDTSEFSVTEVGSWGNVRPVHTLAIEEPGRLLELVRERVTSTVVLQRHVPVRGKKGLFVIARRAPSGERDLTWVYEFEEGIDPDDPLVREAAAAGLASARDEVGLPVDEA